MSEKQIDPRSRRGHSAAETVFRSESARDLFTSLYKRRLLYWTIFIVFAGTFFYFAGKLPLTFTATARVRFDSRLEITYSQDANNPEIAKYRVMNGPDIAAEVELFQAKEVRERVARNPDILNQAPYQNMPEWEIRSEDSRYRAWMNYLYEGFTAEGIPNTSIVVLQFKDWSSERSAKLVNMLGQAYVDHRTTQYTDKTGLIVALQSALEAAQGEYDLISDEIDTFRSNNNLSADTVAEEANQIQDTLLSIKGRLADSSAELATLNSRHTSLAGLGLERLDLIKALPEIAINPAIQSLDAELRATRLRYHKVQLHSREALPMVKLLKSELADAERRHNEAVVIAFEGLLFQLTSTVTSSQAKVDSYQSVLDKLNSELRRLSSINTELDRLVVTYSIARDGYEMAQKRLSVAKTTGLDLPEVRVSLSGSASPPKEPSLPPPGWLIIVLAIVLGLFFAVTVVFVAGYLDRTLDTPGEAERELGFPVLATIQDERGSKRKRRS